MSSTIIGLLSGFFWGLSGSLLGMMEQNASTLVALLVFSAFVSAMHDSVAGLLLLGYNAIRGKLRGYIRIFSQPRAGFVFAGSLLGGPVGMSSYVLAIYWAGLEKALIITALYPLVSTLLSMVITKEKVSFRLFLAVLCSVMGVYFATVMQGNFAFSWQETVGMAFAFLAVLGWSFEGTLSSLATQEIDPDIAIGMRELCSAVVLWLGCALGYVLFLQGRDLALVHEDWYFAIFAGLAGGTAYRFWYWCIARSGVAVAMVLNTTYVFWGTIFAWFFLGAEKNLWIIAGDAMLLLGVILVVCRHRARSA